MNARWRRSWLNSPSNIFFRLLERFFPPLAKRKRKKKLAEMLGDERFLGEGH